MSQRQTFKAHTAVGIANHQQGLEAFTMHGRYDKEKWHNDKLSGK